MNETLEFIKNRYSPGFPVSIEKLKGICGFPEAMEAAFQKASWTFYKLNGAQCEQLLKQMYATWDIESPKDAEHLIYQANLRYEGWRNQEARQWNRKQKTDTKTRETDQ